LISLLAELVKLTDAEFNKCAASLAPGKIDGKKEQPRKIGPLHGVRAARYGV
jgi:hypothetical protein